LLTSGNKSLLNNGFPKLITKMQSKSSASVNKQNSCHCYCTTAADDAEHEEESTYTDMVSLICSFTSTPCTWFGLLFAAWCSTCHTSQPVLFKLTL